MNWLDYGQFGQWLVLFGQNVGIGAVAVLVCAMLSDVLDRRPPVARSIIVGALFGCCAILSMSLPVRVADGISLDVRNVFILVGSLWAGPWGALLATALPAAFRMTLEGSSMVFGLLAIGTAGAIGALVHRRFRDRIHDFGIGALALVGLAAGLDSVVFVHAAFASRGMPLRPVTSDAAFLIIVPLTSALLGSAMSMNHYRTWRRTRRKLVDILETASDFVWETDAAGNYSFLSEPFRAFLGFELNELLGRRGVALGGRWIDEATEAVYRSAIAALDPFFELVYAPPSKDGARKLLSVSGRPHLDAAGRFLGYRGTAVDITERERWRTLIGTVAGQVGDAVGETFLRSLTKGVAEALGADLAFLSRFDPVRRRVTSLVRYGDGTFMDNANVPVDDLPVREVVEGKYAFIPSGVAKRYPRYSATTGFDAAAYAGTPLFSARGDVLGLLSVVFRNPVPDRDRDIEPVLRMYAGRAAAEIERAAIEQELRRSRDRLLRAQRMGKIGSAEVNLITGEIAWSDELYRIFGLDPAQGGASYEWFLELTHPDDREMMRAVREKNANGVQTPPIVYRSIRPDGAVRWMHREVEIEYDASGKPTKFFTTQQDVTERKDMEEALRRSLTTSIRAQRIGRIGIAEIDLRSDLATWSDELCRLYGLTTATWPKTTDEYLRMVHPDDRELVREARRRESRGESTQPLEFRIFKVDGEERWVHREVEIERDESGAPIGLFATQQDITERRRMEEILRITSQHLNNAQRVGKMASIETDLATRRGIWSSEAFRLFGVDPAAGQPRRADFLKLIHPDDRAHMQDVWRREAAGEETEPFEYRLLRADGTVRWIYRQRDLVRDQAGVPTRVIMTHQDITEREELRRQMSEVLAALDVARDGIVLADDEQRVTYANNAALDLLGLPDGTPEIVGRRLSEFQPPPFRDLAVRILASLSESGQWQGIATWERPDNGRRTFFDARIHRLPKGGIVIVIADAGARITLEAEERRRQEWQAQASKLEALGNLAGGIAHDFNNLLGAILGFGQFLVEDLEPNSEPRHFAERIVAVSQRGRSLVQQVLSFSRRSPVVKVEVDLAEAVAEAEERLEASLPPTTAVAVDIRAKGAMLRGDKGQIIQVLINLCTNGSDALGGEPGTVTIAVADTDRNRAELARLPSNDGGASAAGVEVWSAEDGEGWMATGTAPLGACVSITVTDTGVGIPEAIRRQIFEPFFTTKDRGRATGLGLSVVQRVVIELGGAVLVRTRPGAGTVFELVLPTVERPEDRALAPGMGAESEKRVAGQTSILVVDDDESFCAMVDTALRRSGYRVQSTNDPRVAMAWVKRQAQTWDILVTDQTMPFVKGEELVRFFKAHAPNARAIICTGYSSDMTEQRARAAGAEALLLKPFEFERLASLVGRLAQERGASGA